MTLDEIAIQYGTDKATQHSHPHGYTPQYEKFFEPMRNQEIKVLEIGVGGGESIRTWLQYFTNAKIYGIDVVQDTNPWNTIGAETHPRYTFACGSQADATFWKSFVADYGGDWSIVIDDGGHFSDQVITSYNGLWGHVRSGGLYCIEDLGVAYQQGSMYIPKGWPNHMDFIMDRVDDLNLSRDSVKFMHFSKELVIMEKA